jgi:hypothetical protein
MGRLVAPARPPGRPCCRAAPELLASDTLLLDSVSPPGPISGRLGLSAAPGRGSRLAVLPDPRSDGSLSGEGGFLPRVCSVKGRTSAPMFWAERACCGEMRFWSRSWAMDGMLMPCAPPISTWAILAWKSIGGLARVGG